MALFPLGILSAAGAGGEAPTYELISTQIVSGSSTATITFSNLGDFASTYKHLQIRMSDRINFAGDEQSYQLKFNGNSGTRTHALYGIGSGSPASIDFGSAAIFLFSLGNNGATNNFTAKVLDILDPFSTTKNKTIRSLSGNPDPVNQRVILTSGFWDSTASVTSISLEVAQTFTAGSRYSLYGIRG